MRKWNLVHRESDIDPYQVTLAIEFLLKNFPDATEDEVEQVAKRHGYEVTWE